MLYIEAPKDALVRAINANSSMKPPLKVADVTFGNPEVWLQGTTNTRILVTASGNDYTGSDTHYYNRVRIYDHFAGHALPGKAADYPTLRDALVAFYGKYSLPYDPDDIVSYALVPGSVSATLQGRNNSLMFVPNLTIVLPFAG
jgi:hypothetical protein